jgi:adenylate cyclase
MKVFKVCLSTLLIAIFGAALSMTKLGLYLEEEVGLSLLFKLRGPLNPPEKVLIVSIDKSSSEILHLSEDPEKWPRTYYAELIKKLNQQNPAIIAFNIHFGETRDSANDAMLASAMAERSNIILSNYLKQYSIPSLDRQQQFRYERIIDPIPILDHAALETAPFPLPKTSSTVKQFWSYKNSAGDVSTFPSTIFQCYLFKQASPEILQLIRQIDPDLSANLPESFDRLTGEFKVQEILQKIKTKLANDSQSLQRLEQLILNANYGPEKTRLLQSWIALLKAPDSLYLNHYGNTETITTIPFYQAMLMDILNPDLFRNKIVLVGYSETIEPEKNQGLYTVFSNSNGENVSPIEIAATAVANLVDKSWIVPLAIKYQVFLVLGWGLLIASCCRLFSYKLSVTVIGVLSLIYLAVAYFEFASYYIWLPLFIPIILQSSLVLIFASLSHFKKNSEETIKSKEESRKSTETLSCYIPKHVVDKITSQNNDSILNFGELMQGVCMSTDAGQYTTLSEAMTPMELNVLMNQYYSVMFPQVTNFNGIISDVIGDAMIALWAKPVADIQSRIDACWAALKIKAEVDAFNQSQRYHLQTRIGLHYGEMRLGNVGSVDRFEYRAVGDTVNTATRIEGLNKLLGTNILASINVIEGLSDFSTREIGVFILKGKKQPVTIYELHEPVELRWSQLVLDFTKALKLFQNHQWHEALSAFLATEKKFSGDGPTLFYINYLQQHLPFFYENSNPEHPGVIEIK